MISPHTKKLIFDIKINEMQKKKVSENLTVKAPVYEKFLAHTIASGVSLLSLLLLGTSSTRAQVPSASNDAANLVSQNQVKKNTPEMNQVTNVNQLSNDQTSEIPST